MNMQGKAREIMEQPSVFAKLFERPKCKPWDIVKGRRFECCHGFGRHQWWCFGNVMFSNQGRINIPKFGSLTAEDLISDS